MFGSKERTFAINSVVAAAMTVGLGGSDRIHQHALHQTKQLTPIHFILSPISGPKDDAPSPYSIPNFTVSAITCVTDTPDERCTDDPPLPNVGIGWYFGSSEPVVYPKGATTDIHGFLQFEIYRPPNTPMHVIYDELKHSKINTASTDEKVCGPASPYIITHPSDMTIEIEYSSKNCPAVPATPTLELPTNGG